MKVAIELTPEQEELVRARAASRRYDSFDVVVSEALALLRRREDLRAEFNRSLQEARAEAGRDGAFTIEEVMDEIDRVIEEEERGRAAAPLRFSSHFDLASRP